MSVNNDFGTDDALLLSDNFNPNDYVNDFLTKVKSGDEVRQLQQWRTSLTAKNASSSEAIKDIVFERYKQFIETSKEVSQLEREIYELSTLLMDQKQLIEGLMNRVNEGVKRPNAPHGGGGGLPGAPTASTHNPLQVLMQKMDGIAGVFKNTQDSDRILLQNEVTLLDANTMDPLHPVLLVLLNDSVIIGAPSEPGSKFKFHVQSVHALDSLAVVNVKRTSVGVVGDQVLQFLIFPDQLYVKCDSSRVKHDWLDGVEQAKRKKQQENSLVRQATIRAKRRASAATSTPVSGRLSSRADVVVEDDIDEDTPKQSEEDLEWLKDLINEVHDVISRREMETAVEMINEWKEARCQDAGINTKWEAIERTVVKMLSDEVRSPGALHGGSQILRRNMDLLASLNRGTYAMDLFLKRRSKALRQAANELVISEEPLSYVGQVSTLFINGILEVARSSAGQPSSLCQMLQFASGELKVLLTLVRRNVIEVAPSMGVLAHTWHMLLDRCDRLAHEGLDLTFEVYRLLAPHLKAALDACYGNIHESVSLRKAEERWRPAHFDTEAALQRYLEEMSDAGMPLDKYCSETKPNAVNIAPSACHFARVAHALSRDLNILHSAYLSDFCDEFVLRLWTDFLGFLRSAELPDPSLSPNAADMVQIHALSCQFVVSQVMPICDATYIPDDGTLIRELLTDEFPTLAGYEGRPDAHFDEEVANV